MNRPVLIALIAAGVIAAGGIGYFAFQNGGASAQTASAPAENSSELLAPGPLPEQVLGEANAPVTIVEYASLSCSHCREFHEKTLPELKTRYIDTGKVRLIFRDFPLDNFAMAGAMIARCGGEGKYFPIVDAFFKGQSSITNDTDIFKWLENFGKQVGLTTESFEACLSNRELQDNLTSVRETASQKFGVNSTPTFFINGKIVRGALTIEEFEKEIEPLLKS